jgi:hypothetical protein
MSVDGLAPSNRLASIGPRRDHGFGRHGRDLLAQRCGVVSFVGHDALGWDAIEQRAGLGDVVYLAGRDATLDEPPDGIDNDMNLGCQAASGSPERLSAVFLGAPAACWWARTMVESMKTSRNRRSRASAAKTRCHTPARDQRAKRWYVLFHEPNSGGRSRQGLPVRAIHSTASTNMRLSVPLRPGSPTLPGSKSSIRFHCPSRSCFRMAPPTRATGWSCIVNPNVNRP